MNSIKKEIINSEKFLKKQVAKTHFLEGATQLLLGLNVLGVDIVNDPNFKDTAERVANVYLQILGGTLNTEEQVSEILKTSFPTTDFDELILAREIITYGICPHHLLPVKFTTSLAYIPGKSGNVLGISKLVRLVKLLSQRAVLQEQLVADIGNALQQIEPLGIGVVVIGEHMCMQMRGVEKQASIATSKMMGVFKENSEARSELLRLIKL